MAVQNNATGGRIAGPDRVPAELLDVRSVARMLGCSPRHVYRLSDSGKMPLPLRLGGLVRWSRQTILDWIANGCPSQQRPAEQGGGS